MLLQRPAISLLGAAVFLESLRLLGWHFPSWKLRLSNSRLGTHLFSNTRLDCHFKHTWALCGVIIGQKERIHFTAVKGTTIIQINFKHYMFTSTTTMFQTATSGNFQQPMSGNDLLILPWMAIIGNVTSDSTRARLHQVAIDWWLSELRTVDFSVIVGNVVGHPSTPKPQFEYHIFTPKSLQIVGFWVMALCRLVRGNWLSKRSTASIFSWSFNDVSPKLPDW